MPIGTNRSPKAPLILATIALTAAVCVAGLLTFEQLKTAPTPSSRPQDVTKNATKRPEINAQTATATQLIKMASHSTSCIDAPYTYSGYLTIVSL